MADAPILGGSKKRRRSTTPRSARAFNGQLVHESVRAELNARRQGTASTKTRGLVSRRRRQAVAPEGHRPRPRRLLALADLDRRRRRSSARSRATTPSRSTARSAAPRCAARCRCTPSAARSRSSTSAPFAETPSTKQAAALLADWAGGGSVLVVLTEEQATVARSFRNLARVAVLPGERGRHRRRHRRRPPARQRGRARPSSPRAPRASAASRRRTT